MARLSFDEYCERYHISPEEAPTAYAAYLNLISGGDWDGEMEQVDDGDAGEERS